MSLDDLYRKIAQLERRLDALRMPESRGWDLIEEQDLTASAASVTFSSIPSNYNALVLVANLRTDRSAEADYVLWRANGDTGSNYDTLRWNANTGGATTVAGRAVAYGYCGVCEAASSRASNFSPTICYWPNYANTSMEKFSISNSTVYGDVSADADMYYYVMSGRWRDTDAITSLTIFPSTGPNFVADCVFTLYGTL